MSDDSTSEHRGINICVPIVAVIAKTRTKVKQGLKASDKWKFGIKSNNTAKARPT